MQNMQTPNGQQQQQQQPNQHHQQPAHGGVLHREEPCIDLHSSGSTQQPVHAVPGSPASAAAAAAVPWLLLDVADSGPAYLLFADVPGIGSADQLSIQLTQELPPPQSAAAGTAADGKVHELQRVLTITGQRTKPVLPADAYSKPHCLQERCFQAAECSWVLPPDADSEGISAQVALGVLTITVPKKRSGLA